MGGWLDQLRLRLCLNKSSTTLTLYSLLFRVGGWVGGWLEKVELRLSQLSTKIEVEVDLKLSLAIKGAVIS